MTEYEIQPLAWVVKPKGASLFANGVTTIKRDDEGAGQFVAVSQCSDDTKSGEVRFDVGEWPSIKQAIETAFNEIIADELHELKETTPESEPEPTGAQLVGKECWAKGNSSDEWKRVVIRLHEECEDLPYMDTDWVWWKYAKLYREGVEP